MEQKVKWAITMSALFLLSACSTLKVQNIRNVDKIEHNALIYALPKTVIDLEVEAVQAVIKRGPYYKYAKEFLGIENVPQQDGIEWQITKMDLTQHYEPDESHYYLVKSLLRHNATILSLTENGYIVSINKPIETVGDTQWPSVNNIQQNADFKVLYTDMSTKPNIKKDRNRNRKIKAADTTFNAVPIDEGVMGEKSVKKKAKEAADFILKLRKRRFKLLAGVSDDFPDGRGMINDKFPDGESLKYMAERLDALEQEYLSLFMGKRIEIPYTSVFEFTPTSTSMSMTIPLFRFSKKHGVLDLTDKDGDVINIKVDRQNRIKSLVEFKASQMVMQQLGKKRNLNNGIFYRFPEQAKVSIVNADLEYVSQKLDIPQLGPVFSLAPKHFRNRNSSVEFYPELGSIKRINK